MGLTPEEKAQLEALQAKESEPDEDDFDVEIWDSTGAGAKVPYRKGKTWLQRFGIDLPESPEGETDPKEPKGKGGGKPATTDNVTHAAKYFGKQQAS